ncbi:MAG: hypothetical protein ACM3PB_00295 [Betaproteobacteria bacterium]
MADRTQAKELAQKLGIKKGISLAIMNPPYGFVQSLMEIRESLRAMNTDVKNNEAANVDVLIYFSRGRKGLEENFPRLVESLSLDGVLWVGYLKPKVLKADLNEKIVREIGQKNGLSVAGSMELSDEWPMLKLAKGSK